MIVGIPKEIKADEYRVSVLPVGVHLLMEDGHTVLVEKDAGLASGFTDADYAAAGGTIVETPADVFARSDTVVKVKEPQAGEIEMLRPEQVLFTYFHFAASRELTEACLEARIAAVAYETLRDSRGRLPLLTPMSEVAGKMAVQEGAKYLERPSGGRGMLLSGVAGVEPGNVLVLGGGIVGSCAARVAAGMGANVVVMDISIDRLRYLDDVMPANVTTVYCEPHAVDRYTAWADLVIGAVLIPGGKAPRLITRQILDSMKPGCVIVDVSIDQGGCCETSRPTTHHEPTYVVDGVVHYCVANIPGAVARTSSHALFNATLPYTRDLATRGLDAFLAISHGHAAALNMRNGKIANPAVAEAFPDLPGSEPG